MKTVTNKIAKNAAVESPVSALSPHVTSHYADLPANDTRGVGQAVPSVDIDAIPVVAQFKLPGEGRSHGISIACVAALLGLWWLVTERGWISPLFLPSPELVRAAFVQAWSGNIQGGEPLWVHLQWSMLRAFGAFFLAIITGIPLGIAMGVNRVARGIFDPPIEFYRPLPPLAYLPLVVIWFGIDETSKVLLIYLACFAPIVLAAKSGVRSASIEQINAVLSLGATRWQLIRHVIIPAALPEILVGLRIAIGFGWTTLVAAEMIAATVGIGQMVLNASNFLRTDIVIMGIGVIGLVAWSFDVLMRWLERYIVPWKGRV
jgi:taurine transport system permease protein